MIKKCLRLIFFILILFLNIHVVYGEGGIGDGVDGGGIPTCLNMSDTDLDGSGNGKCVAGSGGKVIYGSRLYLDGTHEEIKISESVYDTKGKYIGEAIDVQNKISAIAGRFIGIDAYEEYEKTYTIRIKPWCDYHKVKCLHVDYTEDWGPGCAKHDYKGYCTEPGINKIEETYEDDFSCKDGDSVLGCVYYGCSPLSPGCYYYMDNSKNMAGCPDAENVNTAEYWLDKYVKSIDTKHSYTAKRQDVNDINEGKNEFGDANIEDIGYYGQFYISDLNILTSHTVSKTGVLRYSYNVQKACINPQTAEIEYVKRVDDKGNFIDVPCPKNYIEVPGIVSTEESGTKFPGSHVGQYFIPLNTKSTDKLQYNLLPNVGQKKLISAALCKALIRKYPNDGTRSYSWLNFVIDKSGNSYPENITQLDADVKISLENGCYMAYLATYNVQQKFYNETVEDGKTYLSGYAFYYRPIDYKEPFPNPISKDSYWYGIYDSKTNKINVTDSTGETHTTNLNESYSTISYRTNENYNTKTIRNYNNITDMNIDDDLGVSERIYTSWDGMFLRGTSKFVGNSAYGIDRVNCSSVYALGCGPSNADWEECKKGKTEVCR